MERHKSRRSTFRKASDEVRIARSKGSPGGDVPRERPNRHNNRASRRSRLRVRVRWFGHLYQRQASHQRADWPGSSKASSRMYPEIAIRELVANAIIHQDFRLHGVSPLVEIFSDRIEITNPGQPLISTLRFIDEPPQSRNEVLAALMRRLNICEERGSGIDKVISQAELFQLPAPEFLSYENHTKAVMFAHRKLRRWTGRTKCGHAPSTLAFSMCPVR